MRHLSPSSLEIRYLTHLSLFCMNKVPRGSSLLLQPSQKSSNSMVEVIKGHPKISWRTLFSIHILFDLRVFKARKTFLVLVAHPSKGKPIQRPLHECKCNIQHTLQTRTRKLLYKLPHDEQHQNKMRWESWQDSWWNFPPRERATWADPLFNAFPTMTLP